ncbi:MAG: MraY family glycosyltransferase [Vampirovibrionales bacterium]|nr:MraY family glycosyltransferase [Vampirovibrionales bacterium]
MAFSHTSQILLSALAALAVSLLGVPWVCRWTLSKGLQDAPGERKIHTQAVSRLGGVGIFLGILAGFAAMIAIQWHYPHGYGLAGILVGALLMFAVGVVDDLFNLPPMTKLLGQIIAVSIAWLLGVQVNTLDLPQSQLLILNGLSYPVTVIWLLALANAMNFIDGVDGLAGGVTLFSAITLVVVASFTGQWASVAMAAILAGAVMGFLTYNLPPAKLFMGDSGALLCGFLLGAISVTGVLKKPVAVMLLPILILSVPLLDITVATFRRLLKLKNPFKADADHLHHKLLRTGMSHRRVISVFYGTCILAGALASAYVKSLPLYGLLIISGVGLLLLLSGLVRTWFPFTQALDPDGGLERN